MISRLLTFLVYSNFWIGLGAGLITWETYIIHNYPIDYEVISFVFFATILTYTFQRSVKLLNQSRTQNARLRWMRRNDLVVKAILILSTAACIRHAFYFTFEVYIVLMGCGFLSLFYIVKIPGKLGKNLRDIPSLKIFLIAIVWSATATFMPYFNLQNQVGEFPLLLFTVNFLFIIALTIPFDIRDLHLDEPEKKTIPQLVGEKRSVQIAVVLLIVYWPLLCLLTDMILYASLIGVCLSIILVNGAKKAANDFYFSFLIDGLLILLPVLFWMDHFYLS